MTQVQENQAEEIIYPPEKSMSGSNTTYIGCEVRNARQHYGICLYRLRNVDRGEETEVGCARAMNGNYCQAKTMRAEEQAAGRALYYVERKIPVRIVKDDSDEVSTAASANIDKSSASYQRGWAAVGAKTVPTRLKPSTRAVKPVAKPKPVKPQSDFEKGMNATGGVVDAINDAAKEAREESKPKVETKPITSEREERLRKAREAALRMRGK